MPNRNLNRARAAKNDEYYTQLPDIENELKHYEKHFKGKVVYCNCDDPRVSNFFHYFSYGFERLGLKKLIATCYKNKNINLFSKHASKKAVWLEYNGDKNRNKTPDTEEIGVKPLNGDGDFRSEECVELLKQSDIVVTNPPFSLFREYVEQLVAHDKKFIIIGNNNAVTYKEIFKLIQDNKIWAGVTPRGMDFEISDGSLKNVNAHWFTNLPHEKRNEPLLLHKKYSPDKYPKYDNYDVINVDKTKEIPSDYDGVMGVPISFLDRYNPKQFEILGIANSARWIGYECYTVIKGRSIYNRLLIKNKELA